MSLEQDFEKLNDHQKKIVRGFTGPSLVLAGPGTGKTRTIAVLIGQLLAGGLRMKECLALSFSDKAANELRERVLEYHPQSFDECWISTFHSFCARILREQFHLVKIHPEFKLLTGFKEALLLSGLASKLSESRGEGFPVFGNVLRKRGFQQEVLTFISLMKSNLVSPKDLEIAIEAENGFPQRIRARLTELLRLYNDYEAERIGAGYLDFRDLIRLAIQVFENPDAANLYRNKFRVILIDEFQDTDPAQFYLLSLLQRGIEQPRVMVIGDPRQSIYRFRGANPGMMDRSGSFRKTFKAKVFPLALNYRNAEKILHAVDRLAWKNTSQRSAESTLIAQSKKDGFVEVFSAQDELSEARMIARRVASLLIYGTNRLFSPEELAILVRNNYQIDLLAEALRALHVPFTIAGDMKFFRSEEVTTLISLLKAAGTDGDMREEALRRAFVSPLFKMDPIWIQGMIARLGTHGSISELLDRLLSSQEPAGSRQGTEINSQNTEANSQKSVASSRKTADNGQNPVVGNQVTRISSQDSEVSSHEPEIGNQQVGNQQPEIGNPQVGNPQPEVGSQEPTGGSRNPKVSNHEPAATAEECIQRAIGFAETWRMIRDSRKLPLNVAIARLLLTVRDSLSNPASQAARNVFLLRNMVADFAEVWIHQHASEPLLDDLLPNLDELLTYYASTLEEAKETAESGVQIMTVHQSKGLEFPVVFVGGLCESIFPVEMREDRLLTADGLRALQVRLDATERPVPFFNPYPADPEDHLEEERRLFYVAITRAQEGLVLTWPRKVGTDIATPAPFLEELRLSSKEAFDDCRALSLSELRVKLAGLAPSDLESLENEWKTRHPSPSPDPSPSAGANLDLGSDRFLARLRPPPPRQNQIDRITLPEGFRFTTYAIQAYLECPRRFFLKHILKVRDPAESADPSLAFGRALHVCLEQIHREGSQWARGARPANDALDSLWAQFGAPELMGLRPLERARRNFLARQALDRYVTAVFDNGQLPFGPEPLVETNFDFSIEGFRCGGRFDRLIEAPSGGEIWIIDYKTATTTRSSSKMLDQAFPGESGFGHDLQMPFYLLAACRLHSIRVRARDAETYRRLDRTFLRASAVTVYLRSDLYTKKYGEYKPGFLRSSALNLGCGPAWGAEIEPGRLDRFEANLTQLLSRISSDRKFDCLPTEDKNATTCLTEKCEFLPFCQERLTLLKDRPFQPDDHKNDSPESD